MSVFDYSEYCIKRLIEKVQELKNMPVDYKKELEDDIDELKENPTVAHSIFESVLCNYLIDMQNEKFEKNEKFIKELLELIEELSSSDDAYVVNVIEVSFMQPLLVSLKDMNKITQYFDKSSNAFKVAVAAAKDRFGMNIE